jgi:tripartite-type tricarboxylate transporter receptor subunit TctC
MAFAATLVALALPVDASAQGWPSKPVTMVVPFNPGSATDIVGRLLAEELSEKFGQRFLIENRTGASGNIGALAVAKAAPDGYTILMGTPYPMAFNKFMSSDLKFDPQHDFTPIVVVAKSPQLFASGLKLPAKNLKELMDYAKANPGKVTAGIPGIGTTSHIALEYLLGLSGATMTTVPYRGSPPATDLIGGQIDVGVGLVQSYFGMITTGALRGLAVTSRQRSAQLPNVPTAAESGFPGFEATAWYVLAAPAGTPADIVQKINSVVNAYMHSDKGKKQYFTLDMQAAGGSPEEAKAFILGEIVKWEPVIRKANIRM